MNRYRVRIAKYSIIKYKLTTFSKWFLKLLIHYVHSKVFSMCMTLLRKVWCYLCRCRIRHHRNCSRRLGHTWCLRDILVALLLVTCKFWWFRHYHNTCLAQGQRNDLIKWHHVNIIDSIDIWYLIIILSFLMVGYVMITWVRSCCHSNTGWNASARLSFSINRNIMAHLSWNVCTVLSWHAKSN